MANNQIALMAETPVFDTPYESQGKALKLRDLMNQSQAQDMEMQQKRQAMSDDAGIRNVYRTVSDPAERLKAVYGISPNRGMELEKLGLDLDETRGDISKTSADTSKLKFDVAAKRFDSIGQALGSLTQIPGGATPQHVTGAVQQLVDVGMLDSEMAQKITAGMPQDQKQMQAWLLQGQQAIMSAKDQLAQTTPSADARLQAQTSRDNNQATVGLGYSRLKEEKRHNGVSETNATTLAQGGKPMTELQVTKRRDQIAKDHKAASTTLASMDELLTSANEVLTAPGLKGATGLQSYLPSWPDGGAARAEVKLKNLEGKVTQLGKAAAAMAGAIGPMAVQEWKIVRDMIAAIEPQKGEEALKEQIKLVESTAQGAMQRMREGYERQYGSDFERFPQFQDLPGPKTQAKGPPAPAATKSGASVSNW
jgi:hypothetical protein